MSNKQHYFAPNHLNKEPHLSVWWMVDPINTLCYIQVSSDPQSPSWLRLGDVFEMLVRHISDIEGTLLKDIIIALKTHETISPDLIKKHVLS